VDQARPDRPEIYQTRITFFKNISPGIYQHFGNEAKTEISIIPLSYRKYNLRTIIESLESSSFIYKVLRLFVSDCRVYFLE
jgi:hypothetical protein